MSDFEKNAAAVIDNPAVVEVEAGNGRSVSKSNGQGAGMFSLRRFRAEAEMQAISRALEQTGWHRKRAAQLLRISYRCLLYKIHQYKITPAPAQTLAQTAPVSNVE